MRSFFFLLLAVFVAGCKADNLLVDDLLVDTARRSLPAEVQLHVGQSVLFPREGCLITFEKVIQDSRCPIDLRCDWEGDGATKLKIRDNTGFVRDDTLHTTLDPQSVRFQQLSVRLKSLDPYPVYNIPIDYSKYVVTLEINRAAADSLEIQ